MTFDDLDTYIKKARPQFEKQLAQMVSIPSVSLEPAHNRDIQRIAKSATELLEEAGLKTDVVPTSSNPVVFAQYVADPKYQTITIYNHLDVMPADEKKEGWKTPPFTLTIKDDHYFGRGATDDKGPALVTLAAVRYAIINKIPLNFNILWDLEEERGGPFFEGFIVDQLERLQGTNSILLSDTIWVNDEKPAIVYGLRGIVSFELSLQTAQQDAHSGLTGGAARNPVAELSQVISECVDATTGKVKIPGFYDDAQQPSPEEIQNFIDSGFSVKDFMSANKLDSLVTYDVKEILERVMAGSTFEVVSLFGGYTGPGIKTTIPARATAKVCCRVVPNQDIEKIFGLIKKFIQKIHPDVKITRDYDDIPYLGQFSGPYADAARDAMQKGFGVKPSFVRTGGTVGAVLVMHKHLGVPVTMLGLSLPSHGYHAVDEHFDWHQASGGFKAFVHYFDKIATIKQPRAKSKR